ncbi:hypothetical protein N431DRAFT_490561 [Stipitochalara longipes BDJ]|nr:hypothetical protein N431DRAFT_490561 [Stipitochalara longipes BDJ]
MKSFNILPAVAGLVCIVLTQPVAADSNCDPISKYTTEWFLANTKPQYRSRSFDSSALFYSSGLSDRAKQFARQADKVTIWDVWPCENYWIKGTRGNPLSCIMENYSDERKYFENMSRAFAMKAHKIATVLHRDIYNPPMDTIWARIELPVLQGAGNPGGMVDYITALDAQNTGRWRMLWDRFDSSRLIEETQSLYQAIHQRIMSPRSLQDSEGNIEKRGDFDACPISVNPKHPLY